MKTAINDKIAHKNKIHVPQHGSGNGVDAFGRFNPDKLPKSLRVTVRNRYQLPETALILGYVGRVVKDKGIVELEKAWRI